MMTLPDHVQRVQLEPVAALRHEEAHESRKLSYFPDLPVESVGLHRGPPGFAVSPMMCHPMGTSLASNSLESPQPVPRLAPPAPSSLDVSSSVEDFASLSLKRVSKALKLISPTTNAPIKPADVPAMDAVNCGPESKSCRPLVNAENRNIPCVFDIPKTTECAIKGSAAELPTGSRLWRWICADPESPSRAGDSCSSTSVASDLTLEKSTSFERKETTSEPDVWSSEDSSSIDPDVTCKPFFGLTTREDDCCDGEGIPRDSKLWIWMGKEGC